MTFHNPKLQQNCENILIKLGLFFTSIDFYLFFTSIDFENDKTKVLPVLQGKRTS